MSAEATLALAEEHQQYQAARKAAIVAAVTQLFKEIDPSNPAASWAAGIGAEVLQHIENGQHATAREALAHVRRTLALQVPSASTPTLDIQGFVGVTGDGRPMRTLLPLAPAKVADAKARGASDAKARQVGSDWLSTVINTEIADTERAASSAVITGAGVAPPSRGDQTRAQVRRALATTTLSPTRQADVNRRLAARGLAPDGTPLDNRQRGSGSGRVMVSLAPGAPPADPYVPKVSGVKVGYVRMLTLPSCELCVILAGRWYRWNDGFERHPNCDCVHIPAVEAIADDITIDPNVYFESMSEEQQNKTFGKANAKAIREGGDLSQIVNAARRKGAIYVADDGKRYTREGLSKRSAGNRARNSRGLSYMTIRPTVWQIYRDANGSRERAVELLREYGYILK